MPETKPGPRKMVPEFASEADERAFWESHDSIDQVDWSDAARVRLANLKPSIKSIPLTPARGPAGPQQGRDEALDARLVVPHL